MSLSAWLADAAADKLRNELLGRALDAWEAEDGAFTETALAAAVAVLGAAQQARAA